MEEYSTQMHDGLRYYWDEPPEVERTLFQQQIGDAMLRVHHSSWSLLDAGWQGRRNKVMPGML